MLRMNKTQKSLSNEEWKECVGILRLAQANSDLRSDLHAPIIADEMNEHVPVLILNTLIQEVERSFLKRGHKIAVLRSAEVICLLLRTGGARKIPQPESLVRRIRSIRRSLNGE